ncbi:unnamed protein product [Microthlaspi erraticum]|uniref:Uncharacterized protein n=1 Tax=Microthlaspi erraticum TaxID=1685480 RepID=A0A6D2JT26_9BRAS|nr:unnamed protein product [Microthlaspi erraticum]
MSTPKEPCWFHCLFEVMDNHHSCSGSLQCHRRLHSTVELLNNGDKPDDASPIIHMLRVAGNNGYVSLCMQLNGYVIEHGLVSDTHLSNSLMRFYKTSNSLEDFTKQATV